MKVIIQPGTLNGSLRVPASKSVMQRACAAAIIRKGYTLLSHPGEAEDDLAALSVIESLGATIQRKGDQLLIVSGGLHATGPVTLPCGESGLAIRLFTPLAACLSQPVTLSGKGSLINRPMHFFDEVLPLLGVEVCTTAGKLPIGVRGPLRPSTIRVKGTLSSQFLTGLLFAYAAANAQDVSIYVDGLVSKPYIDLTLSVLRSFGLPCPQNRHYTEFYFAASAPSYQSDPCLLDTSLGKADGQPEKPFNYAVESDWSSASFLLVAGALAGSIRLQGLDLQSAQSDRSILRALDEAGVLYAIDAKGIEVHRTAILPFEFDATDCPDLFPPLVTLAAYANGNSVIKGAGRLAHKESDRAKTLQQEFAKLKVTIDVDGDALIVRGTGKLEGAEVSACSDHRIAMALAVAALRAAGPTTIIGAEAVKKSYPAFFADLSMLGAFVSLPDLKEQ